MSELTIDDLDNLLTRWGQSYSYIPPDAKERISQKLKILSTGYFASVLAEYIRFNILNDIESQKLGTEVTLHTYKWGFVCFGIGTESSFGNIDDSNVPYYLEACTHPIRLYLLGFLNILLKRNHISEDKVKQLGAVLYRDLASISLDLVNLGYLYHRSMTPRFPQGSTSPLSQELQKINIRKSTN